MTPLQQIIIQKISKRGGMSLLDFMSLSLYHPEHGYYKNPDRIGKEGDFVTAPEISQFFGEVIAFWFVHHYQEHLKGQRLSFLELGPGRGTLLIDLYCIFSSFPDFIENIDFYCLETNPAHQKEITDKLPQANIRFITQLGVLPEGPLFFLANEFFDALPIHQYVYKDKIWCETGVTLSPSSQNLCFSTQQKQTILPVEEKIKEGDIIELNQSMISLASYLFDHIKTFKGAGLIIDYGYDKKPLKSTLQAVRHHQKSSFLDHIGESDLTSHVDFGALRSISNALGMNEASLVTQREFLLENGIMERLSIVLQSASANEKESLQADVHRLIDVDQMGELFKVFCLK